MKILGIDPGLGTTGYGVIEMRGLTPQVIEAGTIRTKPKQPLQKRLLTLYENLVEIITEFKPDVMAIEDLYSKFDYPQTALKMAHARGVIFLSACTHNVQVFSYPARRVKMSLTGNGAATKAQVKKMVHSTFSLNKVPTNNDTTDALAIALCHCDAVVKRNKKRR